MSVARASAWLTLLNGFAQATSFLLFAAIAALFGANWQTDAFFLAMTVPALLINPLNNSVTSAFVPLLTKYRLQRPDSLGTFLGSALVYASLFAVLASSLVVVFAPAGLSLMGGGLREHTDRLARQYILLLSPMIVAQTASAMLGAAYNAAGRFTIPAAAVAARYLATLLLIFVLRPTLGVTSLPIAFSGGSILQLVLLWALWGRLRIRLRFTWEVEPLARRSLWLTLPLTAGNTLQQFGFLVSRFLAAQLTPGSVSVFDYASRLCVGVMEFVTSGVFLVTLADWSEVAAQQRLAELWDKLRKTIMIVLFVVVPVVAAVLALREPFIAVVLQRGEFKATLTPLTASVLAYFLVAMPIDVIARTYLRVLLVTEDLWAVGALATLRLTTTVVLSVLLVRLLEVRGLALADSLAILVTGAVVVVRAERRVGGTLSSLGKPSAKLLLSGVAAWGVAVIVRDATAEMSPWVVLPVASICAVATYVAVTRFLRLRELDPVWRFAAAPLSWIRRTTAL
jgi:putative peptidoglycan lipid II flippase